MISSDNVYAVIIAGGSGTRLWPASRQLHPKQIKPFIDGKTMLQATFARMSKVVKPDHIFICTGEKYKKDCLKQLPNLKPNRLILEPVPRNTTAAVGLSAAVLSKLNPDSVLVNVWSDSFIKNEAEYIKKTKLAIKALNKLPSRLIGLPAKPTYPATGYGYLKSGKKLIDNVLEVEKFVEKPDSKLANKYFKDKTFYWNTGIFVCRTDTFLDVYKKLVPKMYNQLNEIKLAWGTSGQAKVLKQIFPKLDSVAIDYAIFEKTNQMAILPADLGWSDIGSWQAVYDLMKPNKASNLATKGQVIDVGSENSLVFNEGSNKLVATAGLKDVIVVNTDDAVLVIDKNSDQEVKKIIEQIKAKKMTQYL